MISDIRTLKRQVDSVIVNISLYNRDIKKYLRKLKTNYGTDDIDDIDQLIESLESDIESIDRKKEKLLKRASKLLEDVKID